MLTPDEIEDIITDLSCRNAAGGIYTGSVHPFARAIEQAARREALQNALGICAVVMTDSMNPEGEAACEACIVAIRALMGEGDGSKP